MKPNPVLFLLFSALKLLGIVLAGALSGYVAVYLLGRLGILTSSTPRPLTLSCYGIVAFVTISILLILLRRYDRTRDRG